MCGPNNVDCLAIETFLVEHDPYDPLCRVRSHSYFDLQIMKPNLVIVADATGSMGEYLHAIAQALREILPMLQLTQAFEKIGLLSYRDYDMRGVIDWSGWIDNFEAAEPWIVKLQPSGGDDHEEAVKAALWFLMNRVDHPDQTQPHVVFNDDAIPEVSDVPPQTEQETIVIFYADAPPHNDIDGTDMKGNAGKERAALGTHRWSWKTCVDALVQRRFRVFPIMRPQVLPLHHLAILTKGVTKIIEPKREVITRYTINLVLALMGVPTIECKDLISPCLDKLRPPKDMHSDEKFKEVVFDVFLHIVQPSSVMALVTNPVFGTYWRSFCTMREDPRRDTIVDRLGTMIPSMDPIKRIEVQSWLDQSYDSSEEIVQICASAPTRYPALVLETHQKFKIQEILEVTRSCDNKSLKLVTDFVTNIRVIDDEKIQLPDVAIPLSLPAKQLFAVLPHLMAKGTMFNMRASVLLACITSVAGDSLLQSKAKEYLESIQGKWFRSDVPENYAPGFVRFMMRDRMGHRCLTPGQYDELFDLYRLSAFAGNQLSKVDVEIPMAPNKQIGPDRKRQCTICQEWRSPTLLLEKDECFMHFLQDDFEPGMYKELLGPEESYWAECRQCDQQYAVVRPKLLNVPPKCHYCRHPDIKKPEPLVCHRCTNRYVNPSGEIIADWTCARCIITPERSFEIKEVTLEALFAANPEALRALVKWDVQPDSNLRLSMYKLKDAYKCLVSPSAHQHLKLGSKTIRNSEVVMEQIREWMNMGQVQLASCNLCHDDWHPSVLESTCCRKQCSTRACRSCQGHWYGSTKLGGIVIPSHLQCPFCKKIPSAKVIRKYNPAALTITKFNIASLDPTFYHGWCGLCREIKPAVARACVPDADIPELKNFRCEDCKIKTTKDWKGKNCPGCAQPTIKTSGCNHISCVCGSHWCYACGQSFDQYEIYDHMTQAHGGYGYDTLYESDDDETDE